MPMYMHTNCLLFASRNKLLNNSTFYHLNCPANRMIRIFWGGATLPIPPLLSSFAPERINQYTDQITMIKLSSKF
jgi:hypothetical protein